MQVYILSSPMSQDSHISYRILFKMEQHDPVLLHWASSLQEIVIVSQKGGSTEWLLVELWALSRFFQCLSLLHIGLYINPLFLYMQNNDTHLNYESFLHTKCTAKRCLLRSNKYFTQVVGLHYFTKLRKEWKDNWKSMHLT